jgi:hypothetical protein
MYAGYVRHILTEYWVTSGLSGTGWKYGNARACLELLKVKKKDLQKLVKKC